MSDDEIKEVDSIQPNGVNAFVSPALGLALVVKPMLTAGDLERWLDGFRVDSNKSIILDRISLLIGAVKAGIVVHSTDKLTVSNVRDLDGDKASWYGKQLIGVYNRYQFIDPN